jgi:mannose-6-phosphate isomerase-like protein (cupin superfamily)
MRRLTISNALSRLAETTDCYRELFSHGSLSVEIFSPDREDTQQPHDRDEIYVIAAGSGRFRLEGEEEPVETGEVLFVPAGAEHQFTYTSNDFLTWVFFYGPKGGERNEDD